MENEGSYVALGLKVWKTQIGRADKLFESLSSEEVLDFRLFGPSTLPSFQMSNARASATSASITVPLDSIIGKAG
jgi:hypothetical protein